MLEEELQTAIRLAHEAGDLAMQYYEGEYDVDQKSADQGPVTTADREANRLITRGLAAAFPNDGIVGEESAARAEFSARTWFVDPIDGTKEFIAANGQFAVMIGLAIDGAPALGVVHHPPSDTTYHGVVGQGAFAETRDGVRTPLNVSSLADVAAARIVRSRSHPSKRVDAIVEQLGIHSQRRMGSFGLKLVEVASDRADVYVNTSNKASLWDGCAPHAILLAAGGHATDTAGDPVRYVEGTLHLAKGFVGTNGPLHDTVVEVVREVLGH